MRALVGLSLMPEEDFRAASAPLFAEEIVDVLEWSFDTSFDRALPAWADALLDHYAEAGRLFGHGVHYSPLSATFEERQARWLDALAREVERRRYVHISEHYGFMTARPFTRGAPLAVPRGRAALEIGRERLARLHDVARCPIGIENLALAWNAEEALAHGPFLDALAGDGFVVLDVHNLYCQIANFDLDMDETLASLPLERVAEIHVSGGSLLPAWSTAEPRVPVRCDTHDDRVPEPVFDLLARVLERSPTRVVIFERLGGTIRTAAEAETMRDDYRRIRAIVEETSIVNAAETNVCSTKAPIAFDDDRSSLAHFQEALLPLLATARTVADVRRAFERDARFTAYRALLDRADPRALGIAARVVAKYARRAVSS